MPDGVAEPKKRQDTVDVSLSTLLPFLGIQPRQTLEATHHEEDLIADVLLEVGELLVDGKLMLCSGTKALMILLQD